ncbi:hypothetical protein MUN89_15725 [Halobacillus salinarum]|uniref:Lipoprotein n=1 Tax=Halobacillus salinarum TaxID=2932257 RepID=A0ABY4EFV8_9BACI|nr:hypothetical protein [Halobacillus salinarum]UOQ43360.1 hypothetical protein MUN89_15725 [Halobacillus salinarum]
MKKVLSIILFLGIFILAACSANSGSVPEYEITNENLESNGTEHLTVSTDATEEEKLKEIVRDISHKYTESDSVRIYITNGEDRNDPAVMTAKYANTDKGLFQTGLESTDNFYADYIESNIDK